jgi:asparaginyl-tRNA synthetase
MVTGIRYRYRSIKTPRARAILRIQHETARAIRQFLDKAGFVEMLAPIIGPVTDPGIRGAAPVPIKFYGRSFTLMTSMILYKQMAVATLPRIYAFSPNVRLEPSVSRGTGRHLAEFYQADLEVARASCEQVMDIGDAMLVHVLRAVRRECQPQLELLGRTLPSFSGSFPRVTFAKAIDILHGEGVELDSGEELPWEAEQLLSQCFDTPFWITEYPVGSRGFYYLQDPDEPHLLRSFDFLLPEGYGEIASGGEREHTLEGVVSQMRRTGEDPTRYQWYLEMLREGIPPSAGFGIGLERLTRYLSGVPHIWECSPFPKVPGIV